MEKTIITSGSGYIDIDAYASCFAYGRLLKEKGIHVQIVSTSQFNESICPLIQDLDFHFDNYQPDIKDQFIILDVSNPAFMDTIVQKENIIEIIDHHLGWETTWQTKPSVNLHIEFIGSVCTLIYEKFKEEKMLDILDVNLCKLLIAGILDNTLNLKASITTARDIQAYQELLVIGHLTDDWGAAYFLSCQSLIEKDLTSALANDMKIEKTSSLLPKVFGQLLVLKKDFIMDRLSEVYHFFKQYSKDWMLNVICLEDGKSYILSDSPTVEKNLESLFPETQFINHVLILEKFLLRKEIKKKAQEYTQKK